MECIYISEANYIKDFKIFLKFDTGESGEVDSKDIVYRYRIAEPLLDPVRFSEFYLDSCPTLAWDCGFDIAPESLYFRVTGKAETKVEITYSHSNDREFCSSIRRARGSKINRKQIYQYEK